jgi:hypothetical protein
MKKDDLRKQVNMRLKPELISELKKEAKKRNRSFTNTVETILQQHLNLL